MSAARFRVPSACLLLAAAAVAFGSTAGCVREHVDEEKLAPGEIPPEDAAEGITQIDETLAEGAPPPFLVEMQTTEGPLTIRVRPGWAPLAAARFRELVESGFYDDTTFFRVVPDFVAQFGLPGDPELAAKWENATIPDEPVRTSNMPGTLSFAKKPQADSATTQVFINMNLNNNLDDKFSPFAEVVAGRGTVEGLFDGYGNYGPDQQRLVQEGEPYLKDRFPKLSRIKTARVVEEPAGEADAADAAAATDPIGAESEPPAEPQAGNDDEETVAGDAVEAADPTPDETAVETPDAPETSDAPETPDAADEPATPTEPAGDLGGASPVAGGESPGGR